VISERLAVSGDLGVGEADGSLGLAVQKDVVNKTKRTTKIYLIRVKALIINSFLKRYKENKICFLVLIIWKM